MDLEVWKSVSFKRIAFKGRVNSFTICISYYMNTQRYWHEQEDKDAKRPNKRFRFSASKTIFVYTNITTKTPPKNIFMVKIEFKINHENILVSSIFF